jgi:hypothetical protein
MGMPPAMSNYGPNSFYPNHQLPPQSASGYTPQSAGGYPPQYHQRMPPQDLDIYSPQYLDLDGHYEAYGREREGPYGDYQYPPPAPESQRYHAPRMPPQYAEEVRYSQEPPTRDHQYMYGQHPPSGRQQPNSNSGEFCLLSQCLTPPGYFPEYYDDSAFESQFDQSMRFYKGEM